MSQRRRARRATREQQQTVDVGGDQSSAAGEQLTSSQKARVGLALGMGIAVLLSGAAVWYRSRSRSKKPKKSKKKKKSPRTTARGPESAGAANGTLFAHETPREAPIVFSASGAAVGKGPGPGGSRGGTLPPPKPSGPAGRKTAADLQGDSSPVDPIKQEAARLKENGNALFKQEKFVEAIDMYSAALELAPDEPAYHGNRALALMRLNQFDEALFDTERMVFLDPESAKALHLRGRTYFELGEYEHARDDFVASLKLKESPAAQKGLENCEKKLKEESDLAEKALAAHMAAEHPNLFPELSPSSATTAASSATVEVIEEEDAKEKEESNAEASDSAPTPSAFTSSAAPSEEASTESNADADASQTQAPSESTSATTESESAADSGVAVADAVAAEDNGGDEQGGNESVSDGDDSDEAAAMSAAAFEDSDDEEVEAVSASVDAPVVVEEAVVASADVPVVEEVPSASADVPVAVEEVPSASADVPVVEEVPAASVAAPVVEEASTASADVSKSKPEDQSVEDSLPVVKDIPAEDFDIVANRVSVSTNAVKDLPEESVQDSLDTDAFVAQKEPAVVAAVNPEAEIGTPQLSSQDKAPLVPEVPLDSESKEAPVSSPANDSPVAEESVAADTKPELERSATSLNVAAPVFVPGGVPSFNTRAPEFVPGQAFHYSPVSESDPAEPVVESFVSPQEDFSAGDIAADAAPSSSEFDTETAMAVADGLVAELNTTDTDAAAPAAVAELAEDKSSTDLDTDDIANLVAELDATTTSAPISGDELLVADVVSSGDSLLAAAAAGGLQSAGDESGAESATVMFSTAPTKHSIGDHSHSRFPKKFSTALNVQHLSNVITVSPSGADGTTSSSASSEGAFADDEGDEPVTPVKRRRGLFQAENSDTLQVGREHVSRDSMMSAYATSPRHG